MKATKKTTKDYDDKESKKALAAMGKCKGTCTFCGKIWHKAMDCYSWKKEENKKEGLSGNTDKAKVVCAKYEANKWPDEKAMLYKESKCYFCKKPGNKSADCYAKKKHEEQNASQPIQLMWWKNVSLPLWQDWHTDNKWHGY